MDKQDLKKIATLFINIYNWINGNKNYLIKMR